MSQQEMPTITSSSYVNMPFSSVSDSPEWLEDLNNAGAMASAAGEKLRKKLKPKKRGGPIRTCNVSELSELDIEEEIEKMAQKRYVQVFVADPDKNVPVEDSLLVSTEPKMTDLDNQELFYELDIKVLLDKHNEKRKTIVDKTASNKFGKEIYLEPIRIRDLKMSVVEIAVF